MPCSSPIHVFIVQLLLFLSLAQSRVNAETLANLTPDNQTVHCGFQGDSDIYGIGIRIGYYTQALSVWFSNYFVLSESKVLRSVNLLFFIALFIGLAWLSHTPAKFHAIEGYFLNHLLVATWGMGVVDKSRFTRKYWRFSLATFLTQHMAWLASIGFSFWLFWRGIDLMERTPCGTFVWAVVKADLYGGFRTAAKLLVLAALALYLPATCTLSYVFLWRRWYTAPVRAADYFHRLTESLLSLEEKASQPVNKQKGQDHLRVLQAAAQTPLPLSPDPNINPSPKLEHSSINTSHYSTPPTGRRWARQADASSLPTWEDLLRAEEYLDLVMSMPASSKSPYAWKVPYISATIFIPSLALQSRHLKTRVPSRSIFTYHPFRFLVLAETFYYVFEQRTYQLYTFPKLFELAQSSPHYRNLSFETLTTTIALRDMRLPDHIPPAAYLSFAFRKLIMLTILIFSCELSLIWNHVSGTGSFGAVGQLVPAVLGVGGLLRVLWVWWDRGNVEEWMEDGIGREVRLASEVYERIKGKREGVNATDPPPV